MATQVLDSLSMDGCQLKQFSGLLESKWLKYHPSFADSTFCRVLLSSALPAWKNVEFVIQTGKAMDVNLYTVDVYQRDKPGIITFNIGKEEVLLARFDCIGTTLTLREAREHSREHIGTTLTLREAREHSREQRQHSRERESWRESA